ncbi:hypothetical protein ACFX16_012212 [Malus domestica]
MPRSLDIYESLSPKPVHKHIHFVGKRGRSHCLRSRSGTPVAVSLAFLRVLQKMYLQQIHEKMLASYSELIQLKQKDWSLKFIYVVGLSWILKPKQSNPSPSALVITSHTTLFPMVWFDH